jgi:hypothetical protein
MKLWHNGPNMKPNEKGKAREVLSLVVPSIVGWVSKMFPCIIRLSSYFPYFKPSRYH